MLGTGLGSTSVTANSSGTQTAQQTYYPYGTVRTTSGTLPTDYTFTGQRLDASDGLMYYGARYYDPAIGRFAQPDSLIADLYNPQSLNRYSYALNNPVRYTDPTGHSICEEADCRDPEPASLGPDFYGTSDGNGGGDTPAQTGSEQNPCNQACASALARG